MDIAEPQTPGRQEAHELAHGDADTPEEVTELLREAFLAGKSARVECTPKDGHGDAVEYWSRAMTERDRETALRKVERIIRSTDRVFSLEERDPMKREKVFTNQWRIRAMAMAAQQLIDQKAGFMTEGVVMQLQSNDEWHYWNIRMPSEGDQSRLLYVPIDLMRFPDVREWREKAQMIARFAEEDKGYRWNGLDYSVRQEMIQAADAARARLAVLEPKIQAIHAVPFADRTPAQQIQLRGFATEAMECRESLGKVPPHYDPITLNWMFASWR